MSHMEQSLRPLSVHLAEHGSNLVGSPVNNVPVEILCRVFSDALKFPRSSFGPSYAEPHRRNLALLRLTAVCKRWRSVASECAVLWTSIAFSTSVRSTIECATLCLGRSKGTMLSVHIWDCGDPSSGDLEIARSCGELLKTIASQSHRLLACELSSPSSHFWSYWTFPAPNLRKLVVQGCDAKTSPIFRGQTPQLESVALLYCTPWPLRNYATLRRADLRNEDRNTSLTLLLDALRGCEALESLALHEYGSLSHQPPRPATVTLPRLLKIDLFSSDSSLILEHLETPSLAGPVIIFDSRPDQDILRSLPKTPRRAPYLQGITKLHVVLNSYSAQYHVAGYREDGTLALYIGVCGVERWFRWSWVGASIEAVASFVYFSSIRSLIFSTDNLLVPWDLWLSNLDHLRELTVSCPRSEGLFIGLLGPSSEDGLPLCPLLQSLALRRCGRYAVVDHVSLMGFVISRYRARRPLRKLKLHKDEWNWIQELDNSWVALAQSQTTKGDNVLIDLPLELDLEILGNGVSHMPGGVKIIDWSRTSPSP